VTCHKLIGWINCLNLNEKIENIMEEGLGLVCWEIEEGEEGDGG